MINPARSSTPACWRSTMQPTFQVQLKIQKPVAQCFDAVVNPKQLSGYFTRTASGPLAEGATVIWSFPEFEGELPVKVRQVVANERIVLEWQAEEQGGKATQVEMQFKPLDAASAMLQISESGFRETPQGIENSYGNCGGW